MTQPRAAIYSRVSTFLQKSKGHSLGAQDEDCEQYAAGIGAAVTHRWEDDESGAEWDLPGLNAMLDAATRREFDVLIVLEHDRLARNRVKQGIIEQELTRAGVDVRYVKYQVDRSTPEGRLQSNIMADFAEYEREKIAWRTARGRRAKAMKGTVVGVGPPPYGYRYTRDQHDKVNGMEPDPKTAPIVRRIFRDVAIMPAAAVAARLNDEGVEAPIVVLTRNRRHGHDEPRKRPVAERWGASMMFAILRNPSYAGIAAYGRRIRRDRMRMKPQDEWITTTVEPMVSADVRQAALDAVDRRRIAHAAQRTTTVDLFLLRGLLICNICGGQLSAMGHRQMAGSDRRYRYYVCMRAVPVHAARLNKPFHQFARVPADALEAAAWEAVGRALCTEELLAAGVADARRVHDTATARRRERLDILDREVTRLWQRMARLTAERLDAEPGSEAERALRTTAADTEKAIRDHLAERATLDRDDGPGLSEAEAATLLSFAAEIRDGLVAATPEERRRIYALLKLRGRVREDREGMQLARHRFTVEWEAVIDLSAVVNGAQTFDKPLYNHIARLAELGVSPYPDFVVDDHAEPVEVFGGFHIAPPRTPLATDGEMLRVYAAIRSHAGRTEPDAMAAE